MDIDIDIDTYINTLKIEVHSCVPRAMGELGICYEFGIGVEESITDAVKLYKMGSKFDDLLSHLKLATCYEQGDGVKKSILNAVFIYKKAAAQGSKIAQTFLNQFSKSEPLD